MKQPPRRNGFRSNHVNVDPRMIARGPVVRGAYMVGVETAVPYRSDDDDAKVKHINDVLARIKARRVEH